MALKPSGLDLVPGVRLRVIDANLQGWKAAFQFDGTGFGTFSGVEFGLDSPVNFKGKPGFGKFVGTKRHVDVPRWIGYARATVSPAFQARAIDRWS
jgi:hypothetical protein